MDKLLALYDGVDEVDLIHKKDYTTFKTSIDIKNLETGEIIYKNLKNKVIISGAGLIARKLFDLTAEEITPSYNTAFGSAMYTPDTTVSPDSSVTGTTATVDNHKILLFCCGIDGCGTENSQVYPVDYKKWISPSNMIPFKYRLASNDISDDLRETYFGRTLVGENNEYVAYYFKKFEGQPRFVQQFVDGTPIDATIFDSVKSESAESYVELDLKITKSDMREYFSATVGIDQARINSISLCSAYPVQDGSYIYYKDIRPLTKLNIPNEPLIDVTKGIEIIYHIYM